MIGLIACAAFSVASCSEDDDCSGNARHMLTAGIYTTLQVGGEHVSIPDTLDIVNIYAFGTDSVIINNQSNASKLSLPLRTNKEETTLVISYVASSDTTSIIPRDTIVFRHLNTPYFLTLDCNFAVKQELTGVSFTTHLLDSVVIINPTASIDGTENIKIYY